MLQKSMLRFWQGENYFELGVGLPFTKKITLKNYLKIESSYKMLLLR